MKVCNKTKDRRILMENIDLKALIDAKIPGEETGIEVKTGICGFCGKAVEEALARSVRLGIIKKDKTSLV